MSEPVVKDDAKDVASGLGVGIDLHQIISALKQHKETLPVLIVENSNNESAALARSCIVEALSV